MWVNLDEAEVSAIIVAMGDGAVVDKLVDRPSDEFGAFVEAAVTKAGEDIFIEKFGNIQRRQFGAYVMSWMWVSEKEAGVPTSLELFDLPTEIIDQVNSLPDFRIDLLEYLSKSISASGEFGPYEWHFEALSKTWTLTAYATDSRHDWLHCEQWIGAGTAAVMEQREVMGCIYKAIEFLKNRPADPDGPSNPIFWRLYLERFIFGELTAEVAAKWLNTTPEKIEATALSHRPFMLQSDPTGRSHSGVGIPRFDIEQSPSGLNG